MALLITILAIVVDRSRNVLSSARPLEQKGCYSFMSNALKTLELNPGKSQLG
jgi:hypothetical protein